MSIVFSFKAELRWGESFDVNTKLSLAKAVTFCKIDSRTFESQCTKRCPNFLNILVSGSTLAPRTEFYTAFPCIKKILVPVLTKCTLGAVSFWVTVKWSICELLVIQFLVFCVVKNFVAGSVSIFSCELVYQGIYLNVTCSKVVDIKIKNSISFSK